MHGFEWGYLSSISGPAVQLPRRIFPLLVIILQKQ
jgi:hypothetical protein